MHAYSGPIRGQRNQIRLVGYSCCKDYLTANGKLQAISSVLNEAVGIDKVSQFGNAVIHHWRLD